MRREPEPEDNQSIAVRILASLRGYSQRQIWAKEDTEILVELLNVWDNQIEQLESDISEQRKTVTSQLRRIEELISENEELKATSGLKGVMSYLKAKSGIA